MVYLNHIRRAVVAVAVVLAVLAVLSMMPASAADYDGCAISAAP
jgi:hypothetical protein